jgi:hypothetical protein
MHLHSFICVIILTACTGTPAKYPDYIDESAIAEARQSHASNAGPDEKVGIEFTDTRDNNDKRDRMPPPTATYKISSKTRASAGPP